MNTERLALFSDAVVAIIITIMVLELKAPEGTAWEDVTALAPVLSSHLLSFVYIGIYWVNHHHLFHPVRKVDSMILWANLHLLFWLSLIPFATAWMGEHPLMGVPAALYGGVLLMCSISYSLLAQVLLYEEGQGSRFALALGKSRKNTYSIVLYALAIPLSMWHAWAGALVYVLVAMMWFVPDRHIEHA